MYVNVENVTYFDTFEAEYIPKEIRKFIVSKHITNIYRRQAYNSIIFGYFVLDLLILY